MGICEEIPFNIWDDYDEDDGDTYGYIEDDTSEDDKEKIAELVYNHIISLKMDGINPELDGEEVDFTKLTHDNREALVEKLEESGLSYGGRKINFYSES